MQCNVRMKNTKPNFAIALMLLPIQLRQISCVPTSTDTLESGSEPDGCQIEMDYSSFSKIDTR
jgi:hypothetical protein